MAAARELPPPAPNTSVRSNTSNEKANKTMKTTIIAALTAALAAPLLALAPAPAANADQCDVLKSTKSSNPDNGWQTCENLLITDPQVKLDQPSNSCVDSGLFADCPPSTYKPVCETLADGQKYCN
jgi:hypothetical protein